MAWRRIGDKPLSEPMPFRFTDSYICGTRGRWVNDLFLQSKYIQLKTCYESELWQKKPCRIGHPIYLCSHFLKHTSYSFAPALRQNHVVKNSLLWMKTKPQIKTWFLQQPSRIAFVDVSTNVIMETTGIQCGHSYRNMVRITFDTQGLLQKNWLEPAPLSVTGDICSLCVETDCIVRLKKILWGSDD